MFVNFISWGLWEDVWVVVQHEYEVGFQGLFGFNTTSWIKHTQNFVIEMSERTMVMIKPMLDFHC